MEAACASDERWMCAALALAQRGLGEVAPNPAVGCVIVKDGHVVGRGWTQAGGRPHAETQALVQAGAAACGASAYVSLEPCAHHGATPPCAEALIDAGITRVVAAARDPDPRTAGQGLARLKAAGVMVVEGVLAGEARLLNAGFFLKILRGRPLVTLKLATTQDGRIATPGGESQWITGEEARAHGHLARARHDAILIGAGTLRADDPLLTCRLPGLEGRSPRRVVLKGRQPLPPAKILDPQAQPETWVLEDAASGGVEPSAALSELARRGVTRLLIEGGARIATAFIAAGLVDCILWYRAPSLFGAEGKAAIGALDVQAIAAAPRFFLAQRRPLGPDNLDILIRPQLAAELA
ncbi:MAG: bifunctional diaminohydroxyphosphoribosylaminopyrimidine deaminase/5-amino-6-(5-phosphoribosylamino)uracil reductase RibD [Pseudomonadota bacterium]